MDTHAFYFIKIVGFAIALCCCSMQSMAQTITGATLLATENFENDTSGDWPIIYISSTPTCYNDSLYAWGIVPQVGDDHPDAITIGSNGAAFWGAWQTDEMVCGFPAQATEFLDFPPLTIPLGAGIAEICFDYNVATFNGSEDFIRFDAFLNGGLEAKEKIIEGAVSNARFKTGGWVTHCQQICLDETISSAIDFRITISASGEQGWAAIDNVNLYYSTEVDLEEKACFDLPPSMTPIFEVCDTTSSEYQLFIVPSSSAVDASWELRDSEGTRLYYGNGPLSGLSMVDLSLQPCEEYTLKYSDAYGDGWENGFWVLFDNNAKVRGYPVIGIGGNVETLVIASADGSSFTSADSLIFSLPCAPECPDIITLESNNQNCEHVGFIPNLIDPIVCPNTCIEATTIRAYFPSVDTTLNLPSTVGVTLGVGTHDLVYEVIYEDGQIVRCTTQIHVVVQLNPTLVCNNQVTIPLQENDGCEVIVTPDMVLEDLIECSEEFTVNIYTDELEFLGNMVNEDHAGEILTYTVTHINNDNLCWGTILVEDKEPPTLICFNDTIPCNHPRAFELMGSWSQSQIYFGESNEIPANIPGGTPLEPSFTALPIYSDMSCAAKGELVEEVTFKLQIAHTDVEDLTAYLVAPNGVSINLLDHPCANTDASNINVTFSDRMEPLTCINNQLFSVSGNRRPAEDNGQEDTGLSKLNGTDLKEVDGQWWLIVYDDNNYVGGNDMEAGQGEIQVAEVTVRSAFKTDYEATDCTKINVELLEEQIQDTDCNLAAGSGARIVRIWQAEDAFGNTSTCAQTLELLAPTFDEIELPLDFTFECNPQTGTGSFITGAPVFECNEIQEDTHAFCDVSFTFEDEVLPTCGSAFKIIRTWTLINWCSGITKIHEQIISSIDSIAPEIAIDDYVIIPDTFSCTASVDLSTNIFDDCSPIMQIVASYHGEPTIHDLEGMLFSYDITETELIPNLPVGITEVTLTVKDECGNTAIDVFDIEVEDLIPPVALCTDTTDMNTEIFPINISVGADGTAKVFVEDIDYGSYDNCSEVTVLIRRKEACLPQSDWSTEALFDCCDEAHNPVILELRVEDAAGNRSKCQREVYVEDPFAPVVDFCPENDTLFCSDLQTALAAFDSPQFTDNCQVLVDSITIGGINSQCQSGILRRTWTAYDLSPKSPDVQCVQEIVVMHQSNFLIQFPKDTLVQNCPDSLSVVGEPNIFDDDCELIAITYEDQVFDLVPDACYKIERHWKAVNWCIFSGAPTTGTGAIIPMSVPRTYRDDNTGIIEYTQTIKVLDSKPPLIACPNDTIICDYETSCTSLISLSIEATDGCSTTALDYQYKIDFYNDGSFDIITNEAIAEGEFPYGTHRIKWLVSDGCGNESSCEYLFTIQDCAAPSPVCLNGLATIADSGSCVTFSANALLAYAEDNCTPSFILENSAKIRKEGSMTVAQNEIMFCCEDVGIQAVEIWVEDEAGNTSYCTTYVEIQDNTGECTIDTTAVVIAGMIQTRQGETLSNVEMKLTGFTEETVWTDAGGNYVFADAFMNENYSIQAQHTTLPQNGVTTFDAVLMTRHILALEELTNPYQLIAADINNDGVITTFDVVQLRQLILFTIQDFPANTSWRFVDANYIFPNPHNPWIETFPEVIHFLPLSEHQLFTDFIAIKIGDVDGSAIVE